MLSIDPFEAVAELVAEREVFWHLMLDRNRLGNDGACKLCAGVVRSELTSLSITYNEISSCEAADDIAMMLQRSCLQEVNHLSGSQISFGIGA